VVIQYISLTDAAENGKKQEVIIGCYSFITVRVIWFSVKIYHDQGLINKAEVI
jgi:hypothetical protein